MAKEQSAERLWQPGEIVIMRRSNQFQTEAANSSRPLVATTSSDEYDILPREMVLLWSLTASV
ncbi:hypothetical protein CK489_12705 [Bradyrhizobium sp. UFLA03-84]|nr:hypothetical protein CK489_12705 [Bradyrhizobium sp. UFLA03-84]